MGGPRSATPVAVGAARARRISAAERRAQYLDVAAGLVTDGGVDAVTMEAVAAGANVNKALLYRQFSNRSELLLTLFEQETSELDARVAKATADVEGFEDKVRAWVHAWFTYMGRRGTLYFRLVDAARTIASGSPARPHRERQRRVVSHHGRWYAEEFGLPPDQAFDLAAMFFAGLSGALDRWVSSPNATTRRRIEESYVHVVLGSLQHAAGATNGQERANRRRGNRIAWASGAERPGVTRRAENAKRSGGK